MDKIQSYRIYFESSYYVKIMQKYENSKRITFNIWPLIFGLGWMFFRKLYIEAFVLVGVIIFSLTLLVLIGLHDAVINIYVLIFNLIIAFAGNTLYMKKAKKDVEYIIEQNISDEEKIRLLKKKGTNTIIAPVIYWVISLFIYLVSDYILK